MSIKELDSQVMTLRELQSEIDRLNAEVEAIKDSIKTEMVNRGEEVLTGNGWKATWKTVTSSRFDSKAFKAADPAAYEAYCKTSTVCRFCLN